MKPISSTAILLASYDGERHIAEQLGSLTAQTYRNWTLHVSDDGSRDRTREIVGVFAEGAGRGRTEIISGPGQGFVQNFLSLACNPDIEAEYFAFCDQDDIWFDTKLERAVRGLSAFPSDLPCVYTSRTRTVDALGKPIGQSPLFTRPPDLRNALVQSIGGGNTMVFNRAARRLLQRAGADLDVPSHDWWTYLAVTACGGRAIYDETPTLSYRQHGSNLVGENSSLLARLLRINRLLEGRFTRWIDANLAALDRLRSDMPPANARLIDDFRQLREEAGLVERIRGIRRLGLYRQTALGPASLYAAALLSKW